VPIRDIIQSDHDAFTPDEAKVLISAFEDTLKTLGLVDRDDPLTMLVAKCIIGFAKKGERDPVRLREHALTAVKDF
jgi:hypothetical protein